MPTRNAMACFWPTFVTNASVAGSPGNPSNSMRAKAEPWLKTRIVTDFVPSADLPATNVPPVPTGEVCGLAGATVLANVCLASLSAAAAPSALGNPKTMMLSARVWFWFTRSTSAPCCPLGFVLVDWTVKVSSDVETSWASSNSLVKSVDAVAVLVGVVSFGVRPGIEVIGVEELVVVEFVDNPDWLSHPAAVLTASAAINIAVVLRIMWFRFMSLSSFQTYSLARKVGFITCVDQRIWL